MYRFKDVSIYLLKRVNYSNIYKYHRDITIELLQEK